MTEQLHKLIDSGAPQPVINERMAGLIERLATVGTDHEKRMRYVERTIAWALGIAGGIGAMVGLVVTLVRTLK